MTRRPFDPASGFDAKASAWMARYSEPSCRRFRGGHIGGLFSGNWQSFAGRKDILLFAYGVKFPLLFSHTTYIPRGSFYVPSGRGSNYLHNGNSLSARIIFRTIFDYSTALQPTKLLFSA